MKKKTIKAIIEDVVSMGILLLFLLVDILHCTYLLSTKHNIVLIIACITIGTLETLLLALCIVNSILNIRFYKELSSCEGESENI